MHWGCCSLTLSHRPNSVCLHGNSSSLCLQVLYDVMLEVTFPTAAIFQLPDYNVCRNKSPLSTLTSGHGHRGLLGQLIPGSKAEGLTVQPWWGHEWSDKDNMYLYGAQLGVCVTQEHLPTRQPSPSPQRSPMGILVDRLHSLSTRLTSIGILNVSLRDLCLYIVFSSLIMTASALEFNVKNSLLLFGLALVFIITAYIVLRIPRQSCLLYDPEGCPPAYTRLRVIDRQALVAHPYIDDSCMLECDGHHWLLSTALKEAILHINQAHPDPAVRSTSISGPAGQVQGGLFDVVPTLVANKPHPDIRHYINRLESSSEWPSQDQRQLIQQFPMKLVLVGHKDSPKKDQEFKLSWSTAEFVLISPIPNHIKQGYIAFKYVMKYFLTMNRGQNGTDHGRSKIGSFHF